MRGTASGRAASSRACAALSGVEGDGGAQGADLQAERSEGSPTIGDEVCRATPGERRRLAPGQRRQGQGGAPYAEGLQAVHRNEAYGRNRIVQQSQQRIGGVAVPACSQRGGNRCPQPRVAGPLQSGGQDRARRR